jgi:iron(III) transport system permease protein
VNPPRFLYSGIILLFVIILLPILFMVISPLLTHNAHSIGVFLFDERHLNLAKNSLGLATGTTFLSLLIGVPLAFFITKTNLWGRKLFRILYLIPILIPPYIHAIVWSHLNSRIKQLLSLDIHSMWGGIFVLTLAYFPFVTLVIQGGLKSIDRNMEEASLLYHGRLQTLHHITLPLVTPHIFAGAIFVFIFSIIDFGVPDILRFNVYPVEIFIQFSAFYDERAAIVLSLPLIAITLFLIVLQKWHMKNRSYIHISGGVLEAWEFSLGKINILALSFCLLVVSLSVGIPLFVLFDIAGPLSNYIRVLNTSIDQITYSFILASSGALTALLLGFSLSYIIERTQFKMKTLLEFAVFIPLAVPAVTMGIGLIKTWNRPLAELVYGSSLIIILGYIARFLPFSVITVASGLRQVNQRLEEAAFLITPKSTQVIRRILIPLLRHSLTVGFFIVFILSFGELGTTLLVIPPGRETIPIKIYNLMHYGADQMVAALCLILIMIVLAFSGLFFLFHKKFTKVVR